MIVLALDSTTPAGSLALAVSTGSGIDTVTAGEPGETVLYAAEGDPDRSWSARLPSDILALLDAHGLSLDSVDVFAVAAGPGSLTGLRVGIATVQGLAFAANRGVAAVSVLDALGEAGAEIAAAAGGEADGTMIGAWANAMRGEVFTALYRARRAAATTTPPWETVEEPAVSVPGAAAMRWRERLGATRLIVVGDVADSLSGELRELFGPDLTLHHRPILAPVIARMALRQAARGELVAAPAVRPIYVRKPDVLLARERAARDAPVAPNDRS